MNTLDVAKLKTIGLDKLDGELELFLSTDGKHTVNIRTTTDKEVSVQKAMELYDFIKEIYGTKQAQAKSEYSKPTEDQLNSESFCPVHKVEMRKYEKNGKSWYSHNLDGVWCNGGKKYEK